MAHLAVPRRILLWMDAQLATRVSELFLSSDLEVQLAHVSGAGAIEAEWRRPSDIIICDLAGSRQIPERVRRSCPTLILVAEDFASAARATYRLQALYCPSSELGYLLEAVGSARPAGVPSTHAFEEGQRELLEQIADCAPLSGILEGLVRLIEEQSPGMVCSILLVQEGGRLQHGAAPSLPPDFIRAIDGSQIGPEEGCCGAAAFRRMPIFVADVLTHEYWAKFRHLIQPLGLRGCWSSPIYSSDGSVTGTFAVYYREPRLPTEWELSLVARATHLASIAIERDRVEQALRRSEARYRQIVDTAYEGVWVLSREGQTWFANARAAELLGTTPEAILGRSIFEFVNEADRASTEEYLLRRAQGCSEQGELRFRRSDGSDFWALVAASPICNDDGAVVGWLGMLTDITQLKRTETTLRKSEEEFRSIFENAAIGMAVVGPAGRVLRSNGALQRLLGYTGAELSQMSFDQFTHPQDVATDLELYHCLSQGQIKSYQLEKRFVRSDGELVWGRLTASLVRVGENEPLLGIGMVEDVTQSRQAQERIAWQAALLDQANDAIIVRDFSGQIQYWSQGAERLYGWSREEAVGRNVQELIYRDPASIVEPHAELRERGVWTGELVHKTRSGAEIAIRGNWTLIRDEFGAPKSVMTINSDITERKRLEMQVLAAQRLESIGTLAGGIAHDFNNILAAVLANVALASEDVAPEHPIQEALSEIKQASLRAAALVRQILTFSRRGVPERRWICLDDIVEEALKLLRATLPASIRIEAQFAADAPEIFADPTQIHQVIMNLGTNAAHAMQDVSGVQHGGLLSVRTKRTVLGPGFVAGGNELRPGVYAQLSFADNGCGMDNETLTKIFDPFFTTKEPGAGTGLGLSVVHGVVRSHDAGIVVRSTPGQGTEFNIYFAARDARPLIRDDNAASDQIRGRGEQLLCIDDEVPVLRATSRLLERLGYVPVSFSDPRQALAALESTPKRFSAVVSDCSMPDIWGLELVRKLRRIAPTLPIVMTSGLLDPALVEGLKTLGVSEFVAKPGTIQELGGALHRLLRGSERGSAPGPS